MVGEKLLAAIEGLILERRPNGAFVVLGALPSWCANLRERELLDSRAAFRAEDAFPFLSVFLPDAEKVWQGVGQRRTDSDMWTQIDAAGNRLHLEATAVRIEDTAFLMIMRNERLYRDRQTLLQRARDLKLTHGALMKELEHKDILVHAIVHDLAAPLHSIMGVLSLLQEQKLTEPTAQWVASAMQAAKRQRELIAEILDVFAAEGGELAPRFADGVDVRDVVVKVAKEREPVTRGRNLHLQLEIGTPSFARVVGDEPRLFRVLTNLLDNAFRHSPVGGTVKIVARPEDASVVVSVEDEGEGVAADVLPRLFEKFARGRDEGAGTGLGLFYCRITLEDWGGGVGYEPRDVGGARFWIRLRVMPPSARTHHGTEVFDGETHARR
jgi:signal transduction histidine kinase